MKSYKDVGGSVASIESLGLVDGPGIRYVIFLNGCYLRCKYCHNPEMFNLNESNITVSKCLEKVKRYKPYFQNGGGVTISGGEPLLQIEFITELTKALKSEGIHVALDTAGVGHGEYEEIINLVDLVILDIKHTHDDGYMDITGRSMDEYKRFREVLIKTNKPIWLRQVIVPDVHDNSKYMESLVEEIKKYPNVLKIELLPYHKMGDSKYIELGIPNPYKDKKAADATEIEKLYDKYLKEVI